VYANVSLEKLTFTFINISLEWSPFYYYSHSCKFNDPWINDSPHFLSFVFFLRFFFDKTHYEILDLLFFWKIHVWMNEWMHEFFQKMHLWIHDFFNAYIVHVWKIYFWKKNLWMHDFFDCIYDVCLNEFFFCEKMHLWNFGIFSFENAFIMHDFFLECIYNVCLNDFTLFMRKCIYEILDFLFLKMHLWMYDFFGMHI